MNAAAILTAPRHRAWPRPAHDLDGALAPPQSLPKHCRCFPCAHGLPTQHFGRAAAVR